MKTGLTKTFLDYGIQDEDMTIIENACHDANIDPDWLKDYVLQPFHELQNEGEGADSDKKLRAILKQALKKCN